MSKVLLVRVRLLLLALLLVLGQHGALLHQLDHLQHAAVAAGVTVHADEQAGEGSTCPTCEAFAQLATPALGAAHVPPLCPAAFLPAPDPCYHITAADAPTARSRGPPHA
jgi:hypothetical protein